ncbi:MAG: CopG family transcriptional regulator [Terracidiphilus sp.]|jgi:RHH-type rel operon transcriptional repressor/antitoxin RelB
MTTSIKLSPEVSKRLDRLAARTGRPKAFYLRVIIESGIAEMEDYYLAADVLERIRKEQEKAFPAPVAKKDPGVGD